MFVIHSMEHIKVIDHNGYKQTSKYIFSGINTKNMGFISIPQVLSICDTILQVKKKISVYVLKKTVHYDDVYLWIDNEKESPYDKNHKFSSISESKNENELLYKFLDTTRTIYFITFDQLKQRVHDNMKVPNSRPIPRWVQDWVSQNTNRKNIDVNEIQNIENHSNLITQVETTKVPHTELKKKSSGHTMVFADFVLSKNNKGILLDIERLFRRFPLSEQIPLSKLGTSTHSETKIHKPTAENDIHTKFWSKWKNEDDKEKNLQFKFIFEERTLQVTVFPNAGISVRCSGSMKTNTSVTEELWKKVYTVIRKNIIRVIEDIEDIKLKVCEFNQLHYRLINSKTVLKNTTSVDLNNLNKNFLKYIPYFTVLPSNKTDLRFIKVSDYLKNKMSILENLSDLYNNNDNETIKHVCLLFMISQDEA